MLSEDRIALVTGGGSGIGWATSLALADAGWRVVLVGRRLTALEQTAATGASDARFSLHAAVISEAEQVRGVFDAVQREHGRLDLLFNNAGVSAPAKPLEELSLRSWKRVLDVNLTGAFLCLQQAFRLFKAQTPPGGRIINNGSLSAHTPRPHSIAYTATKHAVTGLTKSAALDGRPFNIACGQIDIGNAATEMTSAMSAGVPQADGELRPEPVMDVNAVARAVVFMADLPLDANVQFMTVMATAMPFIGRG